MSLKQYREKRDFKRTPEPKGKRGKKRMAERLYLIQKHAASHLHYDFRLELDGVLLSWAVPKGPCLDPRVKRLAMHVEDHPLEYGHFEGIIPKGEYGGGTVMLWDTGTWDPEQSNPTEAYHKGSLKFKLNGAKLKGLWSLVRINKDNKTWLLIKIKDEYARSLKEYDITEEEPNSVASGQSLTEIGQNYQKIWGKDGEKKTPKKKNIKIDLPEQPFLKKISPQLATLVEKPPEGDKWLYEIKFDGYRFIAFKEDNKTRLISRNGKDWTDEFSSIAAEVNQLSIKNVIFDGEIVVLDKRQRSNFQLLQNSIKDNKNSQFIYYIFDLLYYDKYDLTALPLIERKNILEKIVSGTEGQLRYSDHYKGSGEEIFSKACEMGLEGIIAKDSTRPYIQKRTRGWVKVKCSKRQEFVIGGFTQPQGQRGFFGSLLLGTYNPKRELIYNGNVGTGFTEASLAELHKLLIKKETNKMPFKTTPPASLNVTWVKPDLVAEVEFTEWTSDGSLRHPSFKGLRSDKLAQDVIRESEVEMDDDQTENNNEFKLTNPNKILYPEQQITKRQVADYYYAVREWILPYIIDRPLTLVRCPSGYKQECFFQKHINSGTPSVLHGIAIEKKGAEDGIYIKGLDGLMALPQLGALEIHIWGSRIEKIEYPDMIVFDLDPAPDVEWKKVVAAARDIKNQLQKLKLKSFVKTTGGKGLHVVVPIKPQYQWDEVKDFAHAFVNLMVGLKPNEYIGKMTKSKRVGKIFIDYLRNSRGATSVAPYSTRARENAPVATPLAWNELTDNFADTAYTMDTVIERLAKLKRDPWAGFFKKPSALPLE